MTTEQKALAWDTLKESLHETSRDKTESFDSRANAGSLFNLMCSCEMSVQRRLPNLGRKPK